MSARELVKALGGCWHGDYGMVRCPCHDDHEPSLSIRDGVDGRPLFNCFAGCDFRAIKDALRDMRLLPERDGGGRQRLKPETSPRRARPPDKTDIARIEAARAIWAKSSPIRGGLAETYLLKRGLEPGPGGWPASLRHHRNLEHGPTGLRLPALIAAIQGPGGKLSGVQRTFLKPHGSAKATVRTPRMCLGRLGAGAVRLGPAGPVLGVGEGVETGLSAIQLHELPVWAALGTRLASVELPPEVREVQIFADNGAPGHSAAEQAAEVFTAQGRRVFLRFPPERFGDWNDVLRAEVAA